MTKDVSQIEKNQESRPSEFVFVVYPVMERMVVTSIGIFLPFFFFRFVNEAWIPWIWLGSVALFWVLSGKFFEATVQLTITDEYLEQTRLSGSKQVTEYRKIAWSKMEKCYNRIRDLQIVTREGEGLRISVSLFPLFEKKQMGVDEYYEFEKQFWAKASKCGVRRAGPW